MNIKEKAIKRFCAVIFAIILMLGASGQAKADVTIYAANYIRAYDIYLHAWGSDWKTTFPGVSRMDNNNMNSANIEISYVVVNGVTFTQFVIKGTVTGIILSSGSNTFQTNDITSISNGAYYVLKGQKSHRVYTGTNAATEAAVAVNALRSMTLRGNFGGVNHWGTETAAGGSAITFTQTVTEDGIKYSTTLDASSWTNGVTNEFKLKPESNSSYDGRTGTFKGWLSDAATISDFSGNSNSYMHHSRNGQAEAGNKFTHDSKYTSYVFDVYYRGPSERYDIKITGYPQDVTLTYNPTSCTYYSNTLDVTLTSSTDDDVYYTTDGTTPTLSSSHIASGGTVTISGTKTIKAAVLNGGTLTAFGEQTYTYSDSPNTGYYLVGDWNRWTLTNTYFKMQPVYGQEGVYSIYVNAPINMSEGYAVRCVINPAGNTSDWQQCIRPSTSSSSSDMWINDEIFSSSETAEKAVITNGGDRAFRFIEGAGRSTNNGGSYLFVYNSKENKVTVTRTPDIRVLYMLRSDKNWEFAGDYLYDINTQNVSNYNNNYVGTVEMNNNIEYLLTDGYHFYGSPDDELTYNARTDIGTHHAYAQATGLNKNGWGNTSDSKDGKNKVTFKIGAGVYSAEANVVVLDDNESYNYTSSRHEVIWKQAAAAGDQMTKPQVKSSKSLTSWTDMIYNGAEKVWTYGGLSLDNSETVYYREHIYDGNSQSNVETINTTLAANEQGTYKAVYVPTYSSGNGNAAQKLLLSTRLNRVCVDDEADEKEYLYVRTFSDHYARTIPSGLKVYYATAYDGSSETLTLTCNTTGILPANTGAMLVYDGVADGLNFDAHTGGVTAEWVSLEKAASAGTAPRTDGTKSYGYGRADNGAGTNWFVALLTDGTDTYPITYVNTEEAYRNYYLTRFGGKLGFYRVQEETAAASPLNLRKAYLSLPVAVQEGSDFDTPMFATDEVLASKQIAILFEEPLPTQPADGEDDGAEPTATGITTVSSQHEQPSDCFYTLQGMRVAAPGKGIYIYRGKKVIIK